MRRVDELKTSRFSRQLWIDEVTGPLAFARLRAEWNGLHRRSRQAPFLAWEWLYPWWRRVRPWAEPRVFTIRDGTGHLRAILPLCETTCRGARRWGFLGDGEVGSDGLDLICLPEERVELAGRCADFLATHAGRFDVLELLDVPEGAPLIDALVRRFSAEDAWVEVTPRYRCPRIDLKGTWEEFLKTFGRADNLRRRRRHLERQEAFFIERAEQPAALRGALETFFELHARRWQADGGSQGIRGREVRAFHRDAVALLAESGLVRLYTLHLDGVALASLYAIDWDGRAYFYQSGFDPAFAKLSAGLVLMGESVAESFARSLTSYEFLRGEEPYKFEWANAESRTVGLSIVRHSSAGARFRFQERAVERLKAMARGQMGDADWRTLSRWRREARRRLEQISSGFWENGGD